MPRIDPGWAGVAVSLVLGVLSFVQQMALRPTKAICEAHSFGDIVSITDSHPEIVKNSRISIQLDKVDVSSTEGSMLVGIGEGTTKIWNCGSAPIESTSFAGPISITIVGATRTKVEGWSANFSRDSLTVKLSGTQSLITLQQLLPGYMFWVNYSYVGTSDDVGIQIDEQIADVEGVRQGRYSSKQITESNEFEGSISALLVLAFVSLLASLDYRNWHIGIQYAAFAGLSIGVVLAFSVLVHSLLVPVAPS